MVWGGGGAPVAGVMLFRGFLDPVLDRWLETLFLTPYQIRRGCIWLLVVAGWGFITHRLSLPGSLLLVGAIFVATVVLFIGRSMKPGGQAHFLILPGPPLLPWGTISRTLNPPAFYAPPLS